MKKIILSSISLILVAAITVVALAATSITSNPKIDKIKEATYDDGQSFIKGTKGPSKFSDPEGLKAVDKDKTTIWEAEGSNAYTQLNFDKLTTINNLYITEKGAKVRLYHVEAWNGAEWVTVFNSDIIEGYYIAPIDTIKTSALRLWIDKSWDGGKVEIAEFDAGYQRPIEYDREFVHSTYIASNDYVHQIGWGTHINKEYYDSLTDIIMIGSTLIDKDARFTVGIEDNGGNLALAKLLDWDDPLVEKYMAAEDLGSAIPSELGKTVYAGEKGYIPFVKSISDNPVKPNIWMAMGVVTKAQSSSRGIAANALNAMSDPVKRAKFVSDAVSFCKKYDFYGIDIDWEYCGAGLLDTYNKFLIELGTALHAEGKHLSAAQFTGMSTQGGFASVEAIKHLDRVNMMSYDQKGTSGRGNHHSTFNGATVNDIDKYLAHGYPIEKLCLGTAWYGGNEGYNAFFSKLQAEAEATNPGVTNPKVDLGKNFFGGTDGNGVYLIRSRTLYAIQRKMCGLFSFRGAIDINIDEKPENRYASIGIAEKETIEKFVTYKDGVQTKFGEIKDGKPIQK